MQIPGYLVTILEIRKGGIDWRLRQRPRPREWCWITGAWATGEDVADFWWKREKERTSVWRV